MSKENGNFEIGDRVIVVVPPEHVWVDPRDFENRVLTITDVEVRERQLLFRLQDYPGYSFVIDAECLVHV